MSLPPVPSFDTEWDKQLDKVWVLETVDQRTNQSITGGAICLDASGLLLTVAHNLRLGGSSREELEYSGRGYRDKDFVKLDVLEVYESLDLALVRVNKDVIEDANFSCISLEGHATVSVARNEEVVSHVHSGQLPFSTKSGYICYPFCDNLQLRNTYQEILNNPNLTVASDDTEEGMRRELQPYLEYRKLRYCVDNSDEALTDLHRDLPLIQLQGFGNTAGISGCPVFKKSNGQMIGMFSFINHQSQFIIPTGFLHRLVQHWRDLQG